MCEYTVLVGVHVEVIIEAWWTRSCCCILNCRVAGLMRIAEALPTSATESRNSASHLSFFAANVETLRSTFATALGG